MTATDTNLNTSLKEGIRDDLALGAARLAGLTKAGNENLLARLQARTRIHP
jgi:hypothetical protein